MGANPNEYVANPRLGKNGNLLYWLLFSFWMAK